jgi:hypothetical protein
MTPSLKNTTGILLCRCLVEGHQLLF